MVSEKLLTELNKNFCDADYIASRLFNIELDEKAYQIQHRPVRDVRKSLFFAIANKRFRFLPKCVLFAMLFFFHHKCGAHQTTCASSTSSTPKRPFGATTTRGSGASSTGSGPCA